MYGSYFRPRRELDPLRNRVLFFGLGLVQTKPQMDTTLMFLRLLRLSGLGQLPFRVRQQRIRQQAGEGVLDKPQASRYSDPRRANTTSFRKLHKPRNQRR